MTTIPTLALDLAVEQAVCARGVLPERLDHHERWALLLWSAVPHLVEEAREGCLARAGRQMGMASLVRGLLAWNGCRVDDVASHEADADEDLTAAVLRSLAS